jgi:hypothetical protein
LGEVQAASQRAGGLVPAPPDLQPQGRSSAAGRSPSIA